MGQCPLQLALLRSSQGQRQLTIAEAKKGTWVAGSRRARWEIVEIIFWKGRDATSHSRSIWDKKICSSKPFILELCRHDKKQVSEGTTEARHLSWFRC